MQYLVNHCSELAIGSGLGLGIGFGLGLVLELGSTVRLGLVLGLRILAKRTADLDLDDNRQSLMHITAMNFGRVQIDQMHLTMIYCV